MSERAYLVTFRGLWLGGTAVVLAANAVQAKKRVQKDPMWQKEWERSLEAIPIPWDVKVLYFDNGDY